MSADTIAGTGKLDQMLADDVAGAQACVARRRTTAFGRCSQCQCSARRRIEFAGVVGFDDVAIPSAQSLGGAFHQFFHHRYADAEIRRPQHRDPLGSRGQGRSLCRCQSCGTGHEGGTAMDAQREDSVERRRRAEIDRDIEIDNALKIGCRMERRAEQTGRPVRRRDGRSHLQVLVSGGESHQGLSHPAAGAVDQNLNRSRHGA